MQKLIHPVLYKQYQLKKGSVKRACATGTAVERLLFHGTTKGSSREICLHGFNRSFCGKNGEGWARVGWTGGALAAKGGVVPSAWEQHASGGTVPLAWEWCHRHGNGTQGGRGAIGVGRGRQGRHSAVGVRTGW